MGEADESSLFWISEDGQHIFPTKRIWEIRQARDVLGTHETRLYDLLWARSTVTITGVHTVPAGYGELGRELGMDRQNVKHILARLQDKGALVKLRPGRADDRAPALYEIRDNDAILRLLHAQGRHHCVRAGNGILFVKPASLARAPA